MGRGRLAAVLGVLFVFLGLIAVADVAGAPGQVAILGESSSSAPTSAGLRVSLYLSNGGWVDVRADPVVRAIYSLPNGTKVEEDFYFATVTIPAGRTCHSGGTVGLDSEPSNVVNITVYVRVRGPLSEASKTYQFP